MATRIKAINAYRPRITLGRKAGMDDLVEYIARSTGLNEGTIRQVLIELRDAALFFMLRGQPVKLEGLGTYTPTIDLDGVIKVGHRADPVIKKRLNAPGAFRGEMVQRENIGKSSADLVAMWDADHPDDPVA